MVLFLDPSAQALQVLLDTPTDTVRTLSLKTKVQKLYHIVFWHKDRKKFVDVKICNQILKTVTECN